MTTFAAALPRSATLSYVGSYPGLEPRLVTGESASRPLTLVEERDLGTYAPVEAATVIAQLELAGLRGRGGAGFPAYRKWAAVAATSRAVVVANGEEGEPASWKDRWLLIRRPHAVLDGLLLAADATGAERAVIYLSHPETVTAVTAALAELPPTVAAQVQVHVVAHRYVAGEESAVCSSVNGGPALPKAKPPRVFESGVDGLPTLVSNVETLAQAAWIARHGADTYRAHGTMASPGTGLVTLQGACARPGVYEVPYGVTVRDLFTQCGGTDPGETPGLLIGGWFGGIGAPELLDATWCYDALGAVGSGLGCGSVTLLAPGQDIIATAAALAKWYAAESARQCGVCMKGTEAIAAALARARDGARAVSDHASLSRWGISLRGHGACAFLDGAANLARTAVPHLYPVPDTMKEQAS
jgi:NADH:ubiquinone oxidoreductase subunit F (NADH-binding)